MDNGLFAQTTHRAMGTVMTHKAFGRYAQDSLDAVCRKVERLDAVSPRRCAW